MEFAFDKLWMSCGSLLTFMFFIQSILPPDYLRALSRFCRTLFRYISLYAYFEVHENSGFAFNELYDFIRDYLSSFASTSSQRTTVSLPKNSQAITFGLADGGKLLDKFNGAELLWKHHIQKRQNSMGRLSGYMPDQTRFYVLRMRKKDREQLLEAYFCHIVDQAKRLQFSRREKRLYTNVTADHDHSHRSSRKPWVSVRFRHPSTFDTLAMDPMRKKDIVKDLEAFREGGEFYPKVGRSWKRGYLLYGPPGTGKSSMIAAIANFLDYDVYDLELTEVKSNAQLRKLLMHTRNKSVIVIEDIDCSLNLSDRAMAKKDQKSNSNHTLSDDLKSKEVEEGGVSLSGLLNFTDGLWSCCGSEKIFIFTTNHIEKLDPALLRSGRMDKHIHMSYCTFPALKILARNYLNVHDHELFSEMEKVMDEGALVTPAEVSEILIQKRDKPSEAMQGVMEALKAAKEKKVKKSTPAEVSEIPMQKRDKPSEAMEGVMEALKAAKEKKVKKSIPRQAYC